VSASGRVIAPDDLTLTDEDVLAILRRADLELLGLLPRSTNFTFLVRARAGDDELLAVYKPRDGESPLWDFPEGTLYRREVAAYELSRALGWPRVPPTLHRDGPHGIGSVQRFLPFDPEQHYFTMQDDASRRATFRRVALFDVVANNADRKAGHCLLADDGTLFFVDHGVCFNEEPKLRTVIWEFEGEPIDADELAALRELRRRFDDNVRPRLLELLSPDEVDETARRLDRLIATARFPAPGPGRPYPWPPV
jgi:uncharacterized repeat protein (TIGR03843 family)